MTDATRNAAPTDPLLTSRQAAAVLGVQEETLCNWRSTKRYSIEFVKVGRLVKYRQSALDRFIAARTVAA